MTESELQAELARLGAGPELLAEVRAGGLRQQDYTRKTQELSQLREQVAFAMGRQQSGPGAAAPPKAVDKFLSRFDGEQAAETREILMGLAEAMAEDLRGENRAALQPVVQTLGNLSQGQELDRRLESELVPLYGEGIRGDWPQLRGQMLDALGRGDYVDPTAFALRAMPEKATAYIAAQSAAGAKTKSDQTTEGFARFSSTRPGMTPAGRPLLGGAADGNGNGGVAPAKAGPRSVPPTAQDLQARFMTIASQVAESA